MPEPLNGSIVTTGVYTPLMGIGFCICILFVVSLIKLTCACCRRLRLDNATPLRQRFQDPDIESISSDPDTWYPPNSSTIFSVATIPVDDSTLPRYLDVADLPPTYDSIIALKLGRDGDSAHRPFQGGTSNYKEPPPYAAVA